MKSKALIQTLLLGAFFGSLSAEVLNFSKAYALALENANNIRASVYVMEAEKEKINQEESQLYPQINFSASYKKSEYETNPTKNMTRQGLITYTASARQNIYNPDVYSRIDIQTSKSFYQDVSVELEKEELAQKVFESYLNVLKSQNKIKLLESYLEYNRTKLDELTKKFDMNMSNKMDLYQMRVEYNSAQIELEKEKRLHHVYNLKFKQFIGDISYELPKIESDKIILEAIAKMRSQVLSIDNLEKSLKIQQAHAGVELKEAELENAKDGHSPRVTLDAAYSKYDTDTPTIDSPYNTTKYAMVTLTIPVYGGGYATSRVDSAMLMKKAAFEELQNKRKETGVQHKEYQAIFEASSESVAMYKKAIESAELYLQAVTQGYDHGLKSIIDLNEAKNKLYEVKYKYVENMYEMVNSYIGLLMVSNNFKELALLDKLVE